MHKNDTEDSPNPLSPTKTNHLPPGKSNGQIIYTPSKIHI